MRIFGSLLAIVIVAAAAGYLLANWTPKPPAAPYIPRGEQIAAADRLRAAMSPATAIPGEERVETQQSGSASGRIDTGKTITVHLAQDDIDTVLSTNSDVKRQMREHGVDAAQIAFEEPDRVKVQAWVDYQGSQKQVTLTGSVAPNGAGGLSFHTQDARLGLLPLPASFSADRIDEQIGKLLVEAEPGLPMQVESVAVKGNQIYLTGPAKRSGSQSPG